MPKHRVLVMLPSYGAGGAENYALRLIEFAGTDEYEWHVTSGNLTNHILEGAFAAVGAKVHYASPGFVNLLRALHFFLFVRRHRFDVMMSLNGVFGGLSLALARVARAPIRIGWHRRSTPAYHPTLWRRVYAKLSLALLEWGSTRILSNSQSALDYFHGKQWRDSDRYGVIPNGVDAERFRPRTEMRLPKREELGFAADDWILGHVGRVDPAKDHETLFAIAKALYETHPSVRLLLVGIGTDSDKIQSRLKHHGIANITLGLGVRDDVHHLYNAMDVFVFPSVTEGQPNALIEAMLSGLPVITSDISPIREAMPVGFGDRLFPVGNETYAAQLVENVLAKDDTNELEVRLWAERRYDPRKNFTAVLRVLMDA